MGNICQDQNIAALPTLENGDTTKIGSYNVVDWPEDDFFIHKVDELRTKSEFGQNFEGKKLMKHKIQDQYYLGDWDLAGYQRGQGLLYKPDQYIYYGTFDSVPHGSGVFYSIRDKYTYEGQLNHGKIQGKGKLQSHQNLYLFEGTINYQSIPTDGLLTVNHPEDPSKSYTVSLENYPYKQASIAYSDGRQYKGQIHTKTFVPHGKGVSQYPNKSIYEGQWQNGEFHGKGKFTWADGSVYEGQYQLGKKQGSGRFTYPSKKIYEGQWVNGKQEGKGTIFSQSGDTIKRGYWKEGIYAGQLE